MNTQRPTRNNLRRRILIGLLVFVAVAIPIVVYDVDVLGFIREIQQNITRISVEFIAIAIGFRLLESLFTALSWHNILRWTYPDERIRFRTVLAGYQGGVGINAIAPAEAGTFATIGIFRIAIPRSGVPTLVAAYLVQQLAFAFFGVLLYIFLLFAYPSAVSSGLDFLRPVATFVLNGSRESLIAIGVGSVLLIVGGVFLRRRILRLRDQIRPAGRILRQPRAYLFYVFVPATLAFISRAAIAATFMMAFGIYVSVYTLLLVMAAYSVAGSVQVTPGGFGPKQALIAVILSGYASTEVAVAFSLTQEVVMAMFSIVFALMTMAWGFGWTRTRAFIKQRKEIVDSAREPAPGTK